jgi:nucleotide-binding universal stress UspA family protein
MYRHILIPTDGSATAAKAIAEGTEYAREAGARILFFTAMPAFRLPSPSTLGHVTTVVEYEEQATTKARAILEKAAAQAREQKVEFATDYAFSDRPYEAIIAAAQKHGCDAIFMSSHGRSGIPAFWYGSQTHEVLTHSNIPTLVYR